MVSIQRRVFVLGLMGAGVVGCEAPPDVLPKGTPEQQAEAVRATLRRVVEGLAAGQERSLIEQGLIFLPLRWRRQQKEYQELEALGKQLAGRQALVLGEVHVAGRWALIEHVLADGERVGPADAPWFLLYFSGQWRWLPTSIMKDQAVVGMMDSHFDRLWAGWQAAHP